MNKSFMRWPMIAAMVLLFTLAGGYYWYQTPENKERRFSQGFIKGCNPDGDKTEFCECSLQYINDNLTYSQKIKLSEEIAGSEQTPQVIYDAMSNCAGDNEKEIFDQKFMKGCDPDGTKTEFCGCALQYLNDNYTYSEIIKMNEESSGSNQTPKGFTDAAKYCTQKK